VLPRLLETGGSRIVTVSSVGHRSGAMNFDDLHSEQRYRPAHAYYQSKLANLLFTYELDRRLRAAGAETSGLACHPGIVLTGLYKTSSRLERTALSPRLRLPQLAPRAECRDGRAADAPGRDRPGCTRRRVVRAARPRLHRLPGTRRVEPRSYAPRGLSGLYPFSNVGYPRPTELGSESTGCEDDVVISPGRQVGFLR
jgi:NAD(P)-dependent dehydrogenase (short-subunit alcohol dehydrogenase family)